MKRKFIFPLVFGGIFVAGAVFLSHPPTREFFAGIFFIESVSTADLRAAYEKAKRGGEKIKILVVPGHDKEHSGTEFRGVRELDLNIMLAQWLVQYLREDPAFEVFLTQDERGYASEFASFFAEKRADVEHFIRRFRLSMQAFTQAGIVEEKKDGVAHNYAPGESAYRLHAINKWANDNNIDIVIHAHFNDHPGRRQDQPGRYAGFALYIPEKQFSNANASREIAQSLVRRFRAYSAPSNFLGEREGIVEDQDLIAVGARNSLDAAALLIEYGYIYEPQFRSPAIRPFALREAAFQTARAIQDFFRNTPEDIIVYETTTLPYAWLKNVGAGAREERDVFPLQIALIAEGLFPPEGSDTGECPANGNFFSCTESALRAFQKKYGLSPATGFLDAKTRTLLNVLHGK